MHLTVYNNWLMPNNSDSKRQWFNKSQQWPKRELNQLINAANTRTKVQEELAKATALNNAMKALRDSIQNVDEVKRGSNYVNEDQTEQHNYDNAVTGAQTTIDNNNKPVLIKIQSKV